MIRSRSVIRQISKTCFETLQVAWDVLRTLLKIYFVPREAVRSSQLTRAAVALCTKHIHGPKKITRTPEDVIIICPVRDGEHHVNSFISYHLALGVSHIVFLDNGSKDKTVELASQFSNVTVLQTLLPFRTYIKAFRPYLIRRFSKGYWCLSLDIDERFDYPYSDIIPLRAFLHYLNTNGWNAVKATLLDMFSNKPLNETLITPEVSPEILCRFYDLSTIEERNCIPNRNTVSNPQIRDCFGGIRGHLLKTTHDINLNKYPLVRLAKNLTADDIHIHSVNNAHIADISTVLFHFKLTSSLKAQSEQAVHEKNYWRDSLRYIEYNYMCSSHFSINIKDVAPQPKELKNPHTLIKDGLLVISQGYADFINKYKQCHWQWHYWKQRKHMLYYRKITELAREYSPTARSVLDVGSNVCTYILDLNWIPEKIAIDINSVPNHPAIHAIKSDFLVYKFNRTFDLVTCLQVLEHVDDPNEFVEKLFALGSVVIISVPYKWDANVTPKHLHDPIDEFKILAWTKKNPLASVIVTEEYGEKMSRWIGVFEGNQAIDFIPGKQHALAFS